MRVHSGVGADSANTEFLVAVVVQILHDGALPVAMVTDSAQIRERLLRGSRLTFNTREKITKIDQKSAEALSLVLRHCHDARDIVLLLTGLFLREVAHKMASFAIVLRHRIKQERFDIIIECFVIEKQLSK